MVVPALPPFLYEVVKQPAFVRYAAEYLGHIIITTESHHLLCAHSALDVQFPFPQLFFFFFITNLFQNLLEFWRGGWPPRDLLLKSYLIINPMGTFHLSFLDSISIVP